jgi:hypothetical protein
MAYEDSSPERRNLVVTSLAFIAFTYAGGKFNDNTVQLSVINAVFTRPAVLIVMAWAMLFWFIYRYWQINSGAFSVEFRKEFRGFILQRHLNKYVSIKLNGKVISDGEEGFHIRDIYWKSGRIHVHTIHASNVTRDSNGQMNTFGSRNGQNPGKDFTLNGFRGWYVGLRATAACIVKKPSFSSHIVPYIFAILAIIGGLVRIAL